MADAILTKRDGVVTMDKSFDYLCSTLKNGIYTISIKRKVEPRTLSQNADKLDIHDFYCRKFLIRQICVSGHAISVVGSTSKLNTIQMKNFMDKVQADAAAEFGINLPLPADKYYHEFISEYQHR